MDYEKKYKVQKILSEIATRKLCTMDEHMAFYNANAKEDYRFLSEIEELIKASQEDPVSNQKLSNVQRTTKNWKEPVSEELIDVAKQYVKEHVIGIDKVTFSIATDMFISGANWQKQKDSIVSDDLETFAKKESEAFAEREYEIGYFDRNALGKGYYWGCIDGAKWKKKQMIAKAIDGKIYETQARSKLKAVTTGNLSRLDYKVGDKVKVIVIKED